MSRRYRVIGAICGVVLLSVFVFIARPRLSRSAGQFFADYCPCGEYHIEVTGLIALNPLRNRVPEQTAAEFLSHLREGRCDATTDPTVCNYALVEARPLLEWRLRNRHDSGNTVALFYVVKGKYRTGRDIYPHDAWGEGMVQIEQSGTQWRVRNYGVYY